MSRKLPFFPATSIVQRGPDREMTDLLQVQRAYQLNARALASSDEMMNIANRLRG